MPDSTAEEIILDNKAESKIFHIALIPLDLQQTAMQLHVTVTQRRTFLGRYYLAKSCRLCNTIR